MRVQLTNAGAALLDANSGPIQVSSYKLGSDYGYVPSPTDTNIHGTLVYTGAPSQYFVVNSNVVKYSVILDYSLGPFSFGEIGLFTSSGVLFALAVGDELLSKIPVSSTGGNSIRADIYLSMVNQNYEMWLDYADTNSDFRMAVLQSVDQLPPSSQAAPNAYVITGAVAASNDGQQSAFLAYTDRTGLWNFDAYAFANQREATIVAADGLSVTINNADYTDGIVTSYYGQVICEFSTGTNYSICRYVKAVVKGATQTVISFYNPLMQVPIVGDKVIFFSRIALSTTIPNLPIASSTILGAIKVGTTLTIAGDGTLNVAPTSYPVTSVNGMTGDVEVTATDIPGLATVALTGKYSDLIGAPGQYILPIASTTTLGGVKAPSDSNLTIASDGTIDLGFSPVKTVNTIGPDASGNVTLPPQAVVGLVNPAAIGAGTDFNSLKTTGLYFGLDANAASFLNAPNTTAGGTLDVEPFTTTASGGDVIQRYTQSNGIFIRRYTQSTNIWSTWISMATASSPAVATTASLGVVQIGAGINVTGGGVISTVIQSVNSKTATNVVLTAADVGAVPLSEVNVQGGVPSLDQPTSTPVPATDPYTFGRVPFYQVPLGSWLNAGLWDANSNHVQQIKVTPAVYDTNTSLLANGLQTIDISYGGADPNSAVSDYQTVSAEGMVYVVGVAGATTLDGISTWNAGDIAVVIQGKWRRIAAPSGGYYDLQGGAANAITSNQLLMQHVAARTLTFPGNFANSKGYAATAPTASATLTVAVNGSTVGTIVFAAAAQTATFTTTGGTQLVVTPGQVVTVTAPSTADATLANVSLTLLGSAT